ncbi:unnamed protein product [Echinostoma caproni]|uniref:Reverse transcriptase domain-containing protein n=1 Tax=Echinostoma caproni TaxID=27848 RepID=A0A183AU93_9TREM|nr:unnamed protein product [Echinostoma caproni]
MAQNVKRNPKCFYAYVQSKRNTRETVGTLESSTGKSAVSEGDRARILLEFFKSTYRIPRVTDNLPSVDDDCTMPPIIVGTHDVQRELAGPNRFKAAGPDGIHPAIVQPLADVIAGPILELFKESLRLGSVPNDWRKATVVAIHKSGSRQKAEKFDSSNMYNIHHTTVELSGSQSSQVQEPGRSPAEAYSLVTSPDLNM